MFILNKLISHFQPLETGWTQAEIPHEHQVAQSKSDFQRGVRVRDAAQRSGQADAGAVRAGQGHWKE